MPNPPKRVTLKYGPNGFSADPPILKNVFPHDVIEFVIEEATRLANQDCRLRITLNRPVHFSPGKVEHGDVSHNSRPLQVTAAPNPAAAQAAGSPAPDLRFGYKCELVDPQGNARFSAQGIGGGEIEPDGSVVTAFAT